MAGVFADHTWDYPFRPFLTLKLIAAGTGRTFLLTLLFAINPGMEKRRLVFDHRGVFHGFFDGHVFGQAKFLKESGGDFLPASDMAPPRQQLPEILELGRPRGVIVDDDDLPF